MGGKPCAPLAQAPPGVPHPPVSLCAQYLTLPAERLWLLYPRWVQLSVIGDGRCTQQFSKLLGDWSDWQIEEWDLFAATARVDAQSHEWRFAIRGQTQEPRLEGGVHLSEVNNAEDAPFYVGAPPCLWLPRLLDLTIEEQLKAWRVPQFPRAGPHHRTCQRHRRVPWPTWRNT